MTTQNLNRAIQVRKLIALAAEVCGEDGRPSERALARGCGVSQAAIWQARRAGHVSGDLALRIHYATGGEVPAWTLRPDLWRKGGAIGPRPDITTKEAS